ncbi:MAG: hypothetical protein K2X38_03460 [Gemmataceae bacterium]|nr:hypothetical protein [Gemmataceae bacterium]
MIAAIVVLLGWLEAARTQEVQHVFPPELTRFQLSEKAIFTGEPGKWDAKIRERGWTLREGNLWKLWYTGYDGTKEGRRMLGYATSNDGVQWKRHPGNPLLPDLWVEDMVVVPHEGKYWMFAEGIRDRAHLLVSDDGVKWQPRGKLDIRLKSGEPIADGAYGTPAVLVVEGVWHLFYERNDKGVWLATSKDMKVWTNLQDDPVMTPGPAEHDRDMIALNQVIRHKEKWYALYHGCATTGPKARMWNCGVAASDDLRRWTKYDKNPILPVEANVSSCIVVHDGDRFRLYTMHPEIRLHRPKSSD